MNRMLAKGPPPKLSGKQLRKERRKEERQASKKRAAPVVANFVGHDSDVRSSKKRLGLFISALRKSIEREEARLRAYKTPEQLERERIKRKGHGLKGAARPAWEKYPELYPEMHKEEAPEPTADLIEKYSPHCFAEVETRELVSLQFQLGHALLTEDESRARGKEAQTAFRRVIELESSDPFGARLGYLLASLDRGQIIEEWQQVLKTSDDDDEDEADIELLYHSALVSFLAFSQMEEPVEDEFEKNLIRAVEACPEVAIALLNHDIMSTFVDPGAILSWLRDEREQRLKKAVEIGVADRLAGRCDAGTCTSSPRAMAVAYFVSFAQYWIDCGILDAVALALDGFELGEDEAAQLDQQQGEEEDGEAEVGQKGSTWMEKSLRRMFNDASQKFKPISPSEKLDPDDESEDEQEDDDDEQ